MTDFEFHAAWKRFCYQLSRWIYGEEVLRVARPSPLSERVGIRPHYERLEEQEDGR